jgi:hypothetical protein
MEDTNSGPDFDILQGTSFWSEQRVYQYLFNDEKNRLVI